MSSPKIKDDDSPTCLFQNKAQRLFFALWPDDSLRQQLISRRKPLMQAACGRPVSAENLHITLAFLGAVDVRQRECAEHMATNAAGQIDCRSFELVLDCFGHWPRPQVVWLGVSKPPEPLLQLADTLSVGARSCGLSLDVRPYQSHLTLMRKAVHVPENGPVEPLSWWVDRFVLARSLSGPQGVFYEVLREWRLKGENQA